MTHPACVRALKPDGTFAAVGGPPGRWLQPAGPPHRVTLLDDDRGPAEDMLSGMPGRLAANGSGWPAAGPVSGIRRPPGPPPT
jgi:hypothetical protein